MQKYTYSLTWQNNIKIYLPSPTKHKKERLVQDATNLKKRFRNREINNKISQK